MRYEITNKGAIIRFMFENWKRATQLADDLTNAGYDVLEIHVFRRYFATIDIYTEHLSEVQIKSLKLYLQQYDDN